MGIDLSVLDFVMKFRGKIAGETLLLGRQGMHIPREAGHPQRRIAEAILRKYDSGARFDDVAGTGFYAEPLFQYLGSARVLSMDASPYEGADIVHDLNRPLPPALHGKFDTVFDGGTIEHVYNPPAAFENVKQMLKIGGLFLSVNGANNHLGHGFYQFSPELMWRVFSADAGFKVELMQIVVIGGIPQPVDAPDPAAAGRRREIGTTPGRVKFPVSRRNMCRTRAIIRFCGAPAAAHRAPHEKPLQTHSRHWRRGLSWLASLRKTAGRRP
jgi:SAM-dependent methyltransferase